MITKLKALLMRKLVLCLAIILAGLPMFGQKQVSGTVTDVSSGDPLVGVTVLIKGTTSGAITSEGGNFSFEMPNDADTLVFTFLGYATLEESVQGRSVINVGMQESGVELNEVVITALGIETLSDNYGATSSKIDAAPVISSGETGVLNGMQAKAAGVRITRRTGDPGAGSYIQIRGQSTITGNSQPLIVLDGIPISNSEISGSQGSTAGVSQQSRLNDINPDDIESIQILKGASAAALWGSRAANGVILIRTKSGKAGKVSINFRSTFSLDEITIRQPLQTKFGQGSNGTYSPTASQSWGDKIADRSGEADVFDTSGQFFEAEDGTRYYPILQKNSREVFSDRNFDQIFENGFFIDNNLSISGGNEKSTFFFSLADLYQEGIAKASSDYRRSSVRLNTKHNFTDWLKASAKSTYVHIGSDRTQQSSNLNGIYLGLLRTAPDFDNTHYKGNYFSAEGAAPVENRQRSYRRYLANNPNPIYNNPLWTINELTNSSVVDRFITSAELQIIPTSWFNLVARGGVDFYQDFRKTKFPVHSAGANSSGNYTEELIREREWNLDVFGRVYTNIGEDISLNFISGFNINDRKYLRIGAQMQNFILQFGPEDFSNALPEDIGAIDFESTRRTARWYNTLNLGLMDMIYLDLSGSFESASTFGEFSDKTFFYPAASLAWKFTELPGLQNNNILSFGKLRLTYGVVGVQPAVYRTQTNFISAGTGSGWGDVLDAGFYGGGFEQSGLQGNPFIEPERKTEWEIGTDLRFFQDRLSLTATYYQNEIDGLLFDVLVAPSTGFTERYDNAATMENKGVEIEFTYDLVRNKDWGAELFFNFNANRNEVTALSGTESLLLAGFTNAGTRAAVGQPLGVLWGGLWERDANDNLVLDENGFPQAAAEAGIYGDPNPDWRGGAGVNLRWKDLKLNLLFETFQGGDYSEATRGVLYTFGVHADNGNEVIPTTELRNYAGDVVPAGELVRGNIVDWGGGPVLLDQSWYTTLGSGFGAVREQFVGDGSWTRLREVTLSYTLRSSWLKSKLKLQSIELSATGRNLALWTDLQGVDPETSLTGGFGQGLEYFTNPGTKSYLFTLKINY